MRVILILLMMSNAFGAELLLGGVDVGNGKVIQLNIEESFIKEEALVNFMSKKRPLINNGKFQNLEKLMKKYKCENSNFETIEVVERYPFENGTLLSKRYSAKVNIKLSKCLEEKRLK